MGAIRTLVTKLALDSREAVKGLKAYDLLWKSVAKSVETSAGMVERSADRAVAALQRMGQAAAVARSAAGSVRAGAGGGVGGGGGAGRGRSGGQSSPVIDNIVARGAKVAAAQGGLAAGARPVNEATAALGRFATASDRARAKVADLTSQVARNRQEMADLRRKTIEAGDADGTLAARMKGLSVATAEAQSRLAGARRELRGMEGGLIDAVKAGGSFRGVLTAVSVAAGNLASGLVQRGVGAISGGIASAVGQAMDFEKALVDVAKVAKSSDLTAGGLLDPRVKEGIKEVSKELGVVPEQVAQLTAAITASFSGKTDIVALAKDVTKIGVAWDITGGQAGEYFKQTSAGLQLTADETKSLFGSINELGNELGIKSAEIAEAMTRSAGVLKGANLSGETGAALNATLIKAGASAEVAATGVRTFVARLGAGEAATDKQRKAFDALGLSAEAVAKNLSSGDAARAEKQIKDVVAALVEMGEKAPDKRMATLIELFGSESIGSIGAAATATETLASAFGIAGDKGRALVSVQEEYARVSDTSAARMDKLKANVSVLAIELGEALLPHVDRVVEFLTSPEGQAWGKDAVEKAAAAVTTLAEALAAVVGAFAGVSDKVGLLNVGLVGLGLRIASLAGPWGIVAAAAVAGLALIMNKVLELTGAMKAARGVASSLFNAAGEEVEKEKARAARDKEDDAYASAQNVPARAGGGAGYHRLQGEEAERGGIVGMAGPKTGAELIAQAVAGARAGGDGGAASTAADSARFNALVAMRNSSPAGLPPAEAKELRHLSKTLNRAIPRKPGKGRTHKQTKMDRQLAAIDPSVRGVLTRGGETDKGGDLKVADNALDRLVFARQNKANGMGGSGGGLGSVGPGPNITNNYTYVTANVTQSIDARGNAPAADNLASAGREVAGEVSRVVWSGADRLKGMRNAGGVRRGPG